MIDVDNIRGGQEGTAANKHDLHCSGTKFEEILIHYGLNTLF